MASGGYVLPSMSAHDVADLRLAHSELESQPRLGDSHREQPAHLPNVIFDENGEAVAAPSVVGLELRASPAPVGHVLSLGAVVDMLAVHPDAGSVVAGVVALVSGPTARLNTNGRYVGRGLAAVEPKVSVPVAVEGVRPQPAPVGARQFVNLAPETPDVFLSHPSIVAQKAG
jgi:hypothetical protein